jgi:hypothetical protein
VNSFLDIARWAGLMGSFRASLPRRALAIVQEAQLIFPDAR